MDKMEGNIKSSGKWGYSTAPVWQGIRVLRKNCIRGGSDVNIHISMDADPYANTNTRSSRDTNTYANAMQGDLHMCILVIFLNSTNYYPIGVAFLTEYRLFTDCRLVTQSQHV